MSKMRLGMHEEKWDIWNGTQAWGSSTSRGTTQHTGMGGQAQGMTQHAGGMESSTRHDTAHTDMGSSTRHDTAQHTGYGVKHKA